MARAIISVYDKTGVVEFAQSLVAAGFSVISTGGTAKALGDAGVAVKQVSDVTQFPELLDGRVKTLHPRIHAGLLATGSQQHEQELKNHNIERINLVAVNLYPFIETISKPGTTLDVALENIDIGGPTMLRAAAKNFKQVLVVCDPKDYQWVAEKLKSSNGDLNAITEQERRALAAKAFQHVSHYDSAVSAYLNNATPTSAPSVLFPEKLVLGYEKVMEMRYGENPHQQAALYLENKSLGGIANARLLHGPALSYNNILDADAALRTIREFFSEIAAVVVKHTNPCGVAVADDQVTAYTRAYNGDSVSAYGGIVALNTKVALATVEAMKGVFYEVMLAPAYDDDALEALKKRAKLRVLQIDNFNGDSPAGGLIPPYDLRKVSGGLLMQAENQKVALMTSPPTTSDDYKKISETWKVVGTSQPSEEQIRDLVFAWKVCKHVKSNAIVLVKNRAIMGIGAGQPNRVQSINISATVANNGGGAEGSVLASDAFMPFPDNIEIAAKHGIKAIVQPGGSIRDQEVIDAANKAGIPLLFTGVRNFLH